jgi:hypothetical protein
MFNLIPGDARKAFTQLIQDKDNPNVCWEMGLVSARRIRMPNSRPGWEDYQVVWRLPKTAVRGNVVTQDGKVICGTIGYFDPKLYEETHACCSSWVTESFETHEEFLAITRRMAEAVDKLPTTEIPTIAWSPESKWQRTLTQKPA